VAAADAIDLGVAVAGRVAGAREARPLAGAVTDESGIARAAGNEAARGNKARHRSTFRAPGLPPSFARRTSPAVGCAGVTFLDSLSDEHPEDVRGSHAPGVSPAPRAPAAPEIGRPGHDLDMRPAARRPRMGKM